MARQIVTQQGVSEAADALVHEGLEASIVAVQARIGGGSYTTVKRYLDAWRQHRVDDALKAPETPVSVQARANEFARSVWALAWGEAQVEVLSVKESAVSEIAAVRKELTEASSEISRLEAVEAAHVSALSEQGEKLRVTELALAEAQTQARRVSELEQTVSELRSALNAANKEATEKAVEAGRLAGEAESLRRQIKDLFGAAPSKK